MARALTVAALEKVKADPDKRLEIPDGLLTGLYFVVQPTGKKSWAVRYRAHGKPRKLTLGTYPTLDLAKARAAAKEALQRVQKGEDPAAAKQDRKQAQGRRRPARQNSADISGPVRETEEPLLEGDGPHSRVGAGQDEAGYD